MRAEEWRSVDGWPYEVSNLGRVRRSEAGKGAQKGLVLSAYTGARGYDVVNLNRDGDGTTTFVHHLVAFAFLGDPPGDIGRRRGEWQIHHLNGDKTDNRPENLEWVKRSDHGSVSAELGQVVVGEDHPHARLTEDQVRAIRRSYDAGGVSQQALADRHGVSLMTVNKIVRRETWRHVSTVGGSHE